MSEFWARVTLKTYRAAGLVAYPFMGPFLALRARKGKEDRDRRYERYGYPSQDRPEGPLVWFHAASVGEAIAIIPLVERVDALGISTVMTTGTVTSAQVVRDRLPGRTFHQYVPLDLRPAVKRFVAYWKPDLAVFTESEILPMTVLELSDETVFRKFWSMLACQIVPLIAGVVHPNWPVHCLVILLMSQPSPKLMPDALVHWARARFLYLEISKLIQMACLVMKKNWHNLKIQIARRPTWIAASTHSR